MAGTGVWMAMSALREGAEGVNASGSVKASSERYSSFVCSIELFVRKDCLYSPSQNHMTMNFGRLTILPAMILTLHSLCAQFGSGLPIGNIGYYGAGTNGEARTSQKAEAVLPHAKALAEVGSSLRHLYAAIGSVGSINDDLNEGVHQ